MVKRWSMCVVGVLVATVLAAGSARAQDVVIYASDVSKIQGNWTRESSSTGAGGSRMTSTDYGASVVDTPLAAPRDYFEATFSAPSYTTYRVWLRLRATGDSKWNDSVYVQFSDAASLQGSAIYRINTSSALLVNLEPCSGCGVSSWGWQGGGYWLSQASSIMFGASGTHTVRVQTREDGVQVDQIVLSPATYLSGAPGQTTNDSTIVSKSGGSSGGSSGGTSSPFSGTAISLPGTVAAQDFDNGGEGVAYHDTTPGNSGGAYRATDVDIEAPGGTNVGWIAAGEWLNYSVNVATSGSYTAQLRVASPSGGALHLGFNTSGVSSAVTVPSTGGWQNWTTVSVPVSLTAGRQVMTLSFDTSGINISSVAVASASSGSSGGSSSSTLSPYGGTARAIPGTIEAEDFDNGGEGIAYHDTTGGNSGGQYRSTNVDIEASSEGGYNLGWDAAGEWLNYSVNVGASGAYAVKLRVASTGGGSMHVGFNGSSPVWTSVPIPATGGYQAWSTVTVNVTLGSGNQTMTVFFDTGGVNLNSIQVSSGSATSSSPPPASGSGSRLRMMTWNIQHGTTRSGSYNPSGQAQFIASHNPDVVALQEVATWDENLPERYRTLLEQYTGQAWSVVWAPVIDSSSTEGNVILTRLPVSSSSTKQLHATSDWTAMYANRSVAQATVRVNGVNVNVFSTHLDYYDTSYRSTQLDQLMSWAANFGGPRLVTGDFNSWWGEYWITTMTGSYSDTWRDVTGSNENGYTVNDAVRFDYLFRAYTGASRATPTNCYVPSTSLSDHNPVVADFTVN